MDKKLKSTLLGAIVLAVFAAVIVLFTMKIVDKRDAELVNGNDDIICTMDAMQCPDGSFVNRIAPNCEFEKCGDDESGLKGEKLNIVTSFYPFEFFTKEIAGNHANVINLAGASDVHDYTLSPQDRVKLEKSDLVIYQGGGLESWAEDVIPELSGKGIDTFMARGDISLYKIAKEDQENDGDHDHGAFDPHIWLDPVFAQTIVKNITTELSKVDPENSKEYNENADLLISKLKDLDYAYTSGLYDCDNSEVIVSHNAFGYISRRYGFNTHSIAGISTMDEPSAKTLSELKDLASENINYILTEENNIKKFAQTLADETGMDMLPVNPMGRGTFGTDKDYFDVSLENLESFKTALECK